MKKKRNRRDIFWILLSLIILLVSGYFIAPTLYSFEYIFQGSEISKTGTPFQIQGRDEIPDEIFEKAEIVAKSFFNPNAYCEVYSLQGPPIDLGASGHKNNFYVVVEGLIQEVYEVNNLLDKDWQSSYVLVVNIEGEDTVVVYRGSIQEVLSYSKEVHIEGLFVLDNGIHAAVILPTTISEDNPWQFQVVFVFFIILASGIFFFFRDDDDEENKHPLNILFLCLLCLSLGACEINMQTTIFDDDTGLTSISVQETIENLNFARQVPGLEDYFYSYLTQLKDQGYSVEAIQSNDSEQFFIQNRFGGFNELMARSIQNPYTENWIYIREYRFESYSVLRYFALVDPTILNEIGADYEEAIKNELNKIIEQIDFSYSVILPSEISYHNGVQSNSMRVDWQIRMDGRNEIVIESIRKLSVEPAPKKELSLNFYWLGIGGLFLVVGFVFWLSYFLRAGNKNEK